jgi:hypothetical protein
MMMPYTLHYYNGRRQTKVIADTARGTSIPQATQQEEEAGAAFTFHMMG